MPPVAEPPSKRPLLTLLKQARAFGLGLVLATQNPVDIDYKGLGNVGTWFLGRLQTERDKQRLLDGLEGAASGGTFDRKRIEETLSALGNRVFFLHDGRTRDLVAAVEAHSSDGSEANAVVQKFNGLHQSDQQDLLNFLRSL